MNFKAFLNTLSSRAYSLPIVILYVTEGCNLQCLTCSYRQPPPNELTLAEIENLSKTLVESGLRHIVYSGGEPLLRRDFPNICQIFKRLHVKQTLLTNGLLLEKRLREIDGFFSEIIVSIDGPDAATHNAIRGVTSFDQILRGVRFAVLTPGRNVSIRMVIQKSNFRRVIEMIELAKSLHVNRVSFLAADVLSESFGRERSGPVAPNDSIMLDATEVVEFRSLVEEMAEKYSQEIESRFISESRAKLFHLVRYFEALLGKGAFPPNNCNAPMVSCVITSTGNVQPCYFLPAFSDVRKISLNDILNSSQIAAIRKNVRKNVLERCQTCVCTLAVRPHAALFDKF